MTKEQLDKLCIDQQKHTTLDGRQMMEVSFNLSISTELVETVTEEEFTQHITTAIQKAISAWMEKNQGWQQMSKAWLSHRMHPNKRDPQNCRKFIPDTSVTIFLSRVWMIETEKQ